MTPKAAVPAILVLTVLLSTVACTEPSSTEPPADQASSTSTVAGTTTEQVSTSSKSTIPYATIPPQDAREFRVQITQRSADGNLDAGTFEAVGAAVHAGLMCPEGTWEALMMWTDDAPNYSTYFRGPSQQPTWTQVRTWLEGDASFTLRHAYRYFCEHPVGSFILEREDDMQGPQANLMPTSPPSIWEAEDWNGFHFTGSGTASMSETQQIVAYSGSLTYVNQIGDISPKSDKWQQVDDGDIGFDLALPASFVVLDEAPTSPTSSEGSLATAVRDELAWRLTVMDWQPSLIAIQWPDNLVVSSVESVPDGVAASDYLGVLEERWLSNYEAITNDAEIELPASYLRSWQVRLDQNFTPWSTRVDGREALLITSWLFTDQGSIDQRVYLVAATDDSVHVVSFTSSDIWANLAMFHEIILDTYQNQR